MASYRVEVAKAARVEIRQLPGNLRQRVMRLLKTLAQEPSPAGSRQLDTAKAGILVEQGATLRRIRISSWRIVYLVEENAQLISVLAIRKRPPYQYEDLAELLSEDN
jgi:mRNA interferase RelE/StbE